MWGGVGLESMILCKYSVSATNQTLLNGDEEAPGLLSIALLDYEFHTGSISGVPAKLCRPVFAQQGSGAKSPLCHLSF